MLQGGKYGCTTELIGRSGRIQDFPALRTWNCGKGRLVHTEDIHVMNKKNNVNLKLLGGQMNCPGIFPLSKDGALTRQQWDTI